jgi:putative alpha-1,2-mannosidase
MKLVDKYLWGVAFGALLTSCGTNAVQKDYADYVNPFIGTGGHGHTFPGAVVPNGMIQPGPDTRIYGWDACSGYYDTDTVINGFSHLHLSGTGCGDYGEILLMPTVGKQQTVLSEEVVSSDVSFAVLLPKHYLMLPGFVIKVRWLLPVTIQCSWRHTG